MLPHFSYLRSGTYIFTSLCKSVFQTPTLALLLAVHAVSYMLPPSLTGSPFLHCSFLGPKRTPKIMLLGVDVTHGMGESKGKRGRKG